METPGVSDAREPAAEITRRALHRLVWSRPLAEVAADFGLSRNGLAKICDRLLIPTPGRRYWTRQGARGEPTPLPPAPAGAPRTIRIAPTPALSRRPQTRLASDERRAQLIDVAAGIAGREGLAALTLKRVAREAGLSEAQAHNAFGGRADLLVALARRELGAMDTARQLEIAQGQDNLSRVRLSTLAYLRQAAERGALIQTLLNSREVRDALRAEREAERQAGRRRMAERLSDRYGLAKDDAAGTTAILTAVCLRAGRLLAERRVSLASAERLCLAIVNAGNRSVVAAARASGAGD